MKKTAFIVFILLSSCKEVIRYPYQSQENDKWGFIDIYENWVMKPKYTNVNRFNSSGLAAAALHGKIGNYQ